MALLLLEGSELATRELPGARNKRTTKVCSTAANPGRVQEAALASKNPCSRALLNHISTMLSVAITPMAVPKRNASVAWSGCRSTYEPGGKQALGTVHTDSGHRPLEQLGGGRVASLTAISPPIAVDRPAIVASPTARQSSAVNECMIASRTRPSHPGSALYNS